MLTVKLKLSVILLSDVGTNVDEVVLLAQESRPVTERIASNGQENRIAFFTLFTR